LNAKTGVQLWNYTTGSYVDSSPAVVGGVVYIGSWDNNVYALNATSGVKLWSYRTESYVYSSPAVIDGVVYFGSNDHKVYALGSSSTKSPSQSPAVPEFPDQLPIITLVVSIAVVLSVIMIAKKRITRENSMWKSCALQISCSNKDSFHFDQLYCIS